MPDSPSPSPSEFTELLGRIRDGEAGATDRLLPLVYDELRGLADAVFTVRRGHTLQPTALVHEAWMKMAGGAEGLDRFEGRRHFFAVAAKAMRHVLADHAKARSRQKRGGVAHTIVLHENADVARDEVDLVALHDCLEGLAELNERHARVAEMRLLGSMTAEEIAATLGVTDRTVRSDWRMARAWLRRELAGA